MRFARNVAALITLCITLTAAAPASALTLDECRKLRREWLAKKLEADRLERRINSDAEARANPSAAQDLADAFKEARDILESADVEDAKEKIDELREKLALQKGKLKDFLDGVSDGLGESKGVIDKATKGLKALEDAISVLDANPEDPAAAAAEFSKYVGLLNEYLGPLIDKVPGLGSFMEFYTKALDAIATAIGKIQEHLRNQSVELLGEDIYDPRWVDLRALRREQAALHARLRRDCGDYFTYYGGGWMSNADYQALREEEAAAAAAAQAAAAERARVAAVKRKCEGYLREYSRIKRQIEAKNRQLAENGRGASANEAPAAAKARADRAQQLAREANQLHGELQEVERKIRLECGDDAQDVVNRMDQAGWELQQSTRTGNAGAQRAYRASEIATAKQEIRDCWDRCKECQEELERLEKDLESKQGDLESKRGEIEDKKKEIQDLTDAYDETKDKAKTHVYESSTGALVLSATGGPQPTLSYKGWVITGEDQGAVREAKRKQEQAESELSDLETEAQDLEKQVEEARDALRRKREECEACRKECSEKLTALRDGGLGDWMGRLGDDGKIWEEGEAFVRQAVRTEGSAFSAERRATRVLEAGRSSQPVALIPNIVGAAGFSTTFAAGKSAGVLGAAAARLAPFAGALIAGPGAAFVADPAVLGAMAAGERPRPRRNVQPPPRALRVGPQQPGPVAGGRGPTVFAPGGPTGTPVHSGAGGSGQVPTGGPLGFRTDGTGDAGTEGLVSGGATAGTFDQSGGGDGIRRPRSGTPTDPGIGAGKAQSSAVGVREVTRWQQVKEQIRQLLAAYVNRDLSGVLRTFAPGAWQDLTVLRNAIQEDFQNETNVNIDVELLSYYMTFDTVQVRVRVNRNATDQTTGQVTVQTGVATLYFLRHEDLRMAAWFGFTPFGLFDQAWLEQARAGDQNFGGSPGASPMAPSGPVLQSAGPFLVEDPFGSPSNGVDHVFVNFDTNTAGTFDQNGGGGCGGSCSQPGMDLLIFGNTPSTGEVSVNVLDGQASGGTPPNPVFDRCSSGLSLSSYGPLGGSFTGNFDTFNGFGTQTFVYGVQTTGGQFALVAVIARDAGAILEISLQWFVSPTMSMVGPGSSTCSP